MTTPKTPLSPHLQLHKWQLPMLLSIVHRGTGIFLSIGALLLSYWLLAIASGPQSYARILALLRAWHWEVLLVAVVFSLYYHLCNGVRHLFWDTGRGYNIQTAHRSGYLVVIITLLLTAATCALAMWST